MEQRNEDRRVTERHPITGTASVASIRHAVRDSLVGLRVDSQLIDDCLVAVTEACTNALIHGKRNRAAPAPTISWEVDASSAQFFVQDFSRRRWSLSEPAVNPIGGRAGGFGLHLIAGLMDEVHMSIVAEGTRVRMVKRF
jgi:serine/threonine-protein kinase RsbW